MGRIQLEYANWHVTARGARRLLLFHDDADCRVFYGLLGESCEFTKMDLIADCLMPNHFHLSLGGGTNELSACMKRLNRAYSGYHNERYGLSGHAFDRRYYGEPIPNDFILKRVVRYIHLNPVRAGKVKLPEAYAWSSYRRMISAGEEALSTKERSFLRLFGSSLSAAQKEYREFTESDIDRPVVTAGGRTPAWEIWQEQFRWFLEPLRTQPQSLLPLTPEEVAVYLGSKAGIPPRAMGRVLGHPDGRVVSEMKRRINRLLSESASLRLKIDSLNLL